MNDTPRTVKRWCGWAAAGTETAAMNRMVEAHGDHDEDTPYVLASDYDALERAHAAALEEIVELKKDIAAFRKNADKWFALYKQEREKLKVAEEAMAESIAHDEKVLEFEYVQAFLDDPAVRSSYEPEFARRTKLIAALAKIREGT